jgi:large subunit ribosomal protein L19
MLFVAVSTSIVMTHTLLHSSTVVTSQLRTDLPDVRSGNIVEVHYKIKEGDKERVQIFKGVVTSVKGGTSLDSSFTVLKNSTAGVKVDRTFPRHSPLIVTIVITDSGKTRQSKPNFLKTAKDPLRHGKRV